MDSTKSTAPMGTLRRQARRHNYAVRLVPQSPTSPTSPEEDLRVVPLRAVPRARLTRAVHINETEVERFERQIRRMAAVDPMVDMATQDSVEWVREGTRALDAHHLREAHTQFTRALRLLGIEPTPCQLKLRLRVQALVGLARLHAKRARRVKDNARAWIYQFAQAHHYEALALDQSERALARSNVDGQMELFIAEHRDKSRLNLREISKQLCSTLEVHIIYQRPKTRVSRETVETLTVSNQAWLRSLEDFVVERSRAGDALLEDYDVTPAPAKPSQSTAPAQQPILVQLKTPKKKKTSLKQVRRVVDNLKQRLTTDLRVRQQQRNLLRNMKASDTVSSKISPLAFSTALSENNSDINALFESALLRDQEEFPPELEDDDNLEEDDEEEDDEDGDNQRLPNGFDASVQQESIQNDDDTESIFSLNGEQLTNGDKISELSYSTASCTSPVNLYVENDDPWEAPDILKLWKNHETQKQNGDHQPNNATRKVYEHVSKESQELNALFTEAKDFLSTHGPYEPLSPCAIRRALAEILAQVSARLLARNRMDLAQSVCALAMDLALRADTHDYTVQMTLSRLLCRAAKIRCANKDYAPAQTLVEAAIEMLEQVNHSPEVTSEALAAAWRQLGDVRLASVIKDEDLPERVMQAVQEELRTEALHEQGYLQGKVYAPSRMRQDELEALTAPIEAYEKALGLLKKVTKPELAQLEVVCRLADLRVLLGDYEKAVEHFEQCLLFFKRSPGALDENAHVLAMLGIAHYLLANYPKAVAMLECANVLQTSANGVDKATFEQAFTVSVLGATCHLLQQPEKAVKWSTKAFELFQTLYKDKLARLESRPAWFVTHTLFVLGQSYETVGSHQKALQYLDLARTLCEGREEKDAKQLVKILKCTADTYRANHEEDKAAEYYNKAIKISETIKEEKYSKNNNQLFNRMAGVHVTKKDFKMASKYLDQVVGPQKPQKNVETTIKTDMFGVLSQLGVSFAVAGDVTRAVECLEECIDSQGEVKRSELSAEERIKMAEIFCLLATLYHVQSVLDHDFSKVQRQLERAEQLYMRAVTFHNDGPASVMYANFLYHEDRYSEAVQVLASRLRGPSARKDATHAQYEGVAQSILPAHLHAELQEVKQVRLSAYAFAHFLGLLCYRRLGRKKDAQMCLDGLYKTAQVAGDSETDKLNHVMLAVALMELGLLSDVDATKEVHFFTYGDWGHEVSGATVRAALGASGEERPERARATLYASEEFTLKPHTINEQRSPARKDSFNKSNGAVTTSPKSHVNGNHQATMPRVADGSKAANDVGVRHQFAIPVEPETKPAVVAVKRMVSREKSWTTEEETVDTPPELLNLLMKNQEREQRRSQEREQRKSIDKEAEELKREVEKEEDWITVEETIDAPPELVLHLQKIDNKTLVDDNQTAKRQQTVSENAAKSAPPTVVVDTSDEKSTNQDAPVSSSNNMPRNTASDSRMSRRRPNTLTTTDAVTKQQSPTSSPQRRHYFSMSPNRAAPPSPSFPAPTSPLSPSASHSPARSVDAPRAAPSRRTRARSRDAVPATFSVAPTEQDSLLSNADSGVTWHIEDDMDGDKEKLRVLQALREARARDKSPRVSGRLRGPLSPTEASAPDADWDSARSPGSQRRVRPVVRRPTLRAEPHSQVDDVTPETEQPPMTKREEPTDTSYQSRYRNLYSPPDGAASTLSSRYDEPRSTSRVQRSATFSSRTSRPRMGAARRAWDEQH